VTQPLVITAAITGAITSRDQSEYLPITVEDIVAAGVGAWQAGAAMLHIHAREEDGEPTQRLERFAPIVQGLEAAGCEAILNLSTGSAGGRASGTVRYQCLELAPEVASFDCGSVNFGERVFENPMPFLRSMAQAFLDRGVKPEIECFEAGHIENALQLRAEGLLSDPLHFQFVLGLKGGSPATLEHAVFLRSLLPPGATWGLCGLGRHQLPMNLISLVSDGHARTGLEDNVYYGRGVLAESNAQLVARIARLAKELGRALATPDQARELLSLGQAATPAAQPE
jgi:3-keto-5-aminohexanoate cleavage enzyme